MLNKSPGYWFAKLEISIEDNDWECAGVCLKELKAAGYDITITDRLLVKKPPVVLDEPPTLITPEIWAAIGRKLGMHT